MSYSNLELLKQAIEITKDRINDSRSTEIVLEKVYNKLKELNEDTRN